MNQLAIVTGAQGWLGSRLVGALRGGLPDGLAHLGDPSRPVRALIHEDGVPLPAGIDGVRGDLRRPDDLAALLTDARGATVFHCAGLIHPALWVSDLRAVNVDGTRNLLDAAIRAGAKRFVHLSSNSPIGCNPTPNDAFDEDSPYNPYLQYGQTKREAEALVREAHRRGDIEAVILRPPWFYGPNQPPRQSLFFSMIKNGRVPQVGDGTNRRSMVYVDNLCQGALLAERVEAAAGNTYWIADARAYDMNEVISTIADVIEQDFGMPVSRGRMRLPAWVGPFAELVDRVMQAVGVYHQKVHVLGELDKNIVCRIDRARAELGYDPKVALREGMRRSIQDLHDRGVRLA
jgi:nucleoside-diphosphate-sugar epimerase